MSNAGATYDSYQFNCDVVVAAPNISITRSQVNGIIYTQAQESGLLFQDIKVDGQNSTLQCIGKSQDSRGSNQAGFTIERADISNCAQGVYTTNFTMKDSYIHDIYGSGAAHTEAVLGFGPGNIDIEHTAMHAQYNSSSSLSSGGGMSSVVSFYTHTSYWPDIDNVTFEYNYLAVSDPYGIGHNAGYCLYGGNAAAYVGGGDPGKLTNGVFRYNVFARGPVGKCGYSGPVIGAAKSTGSCWSNNAYDDGTVIPADDGAPACP